jgi:protein kinase A
VLLGQGHGKAVDWWTLGVFIYEMLGGVNPFADDDPMSVYRKILKGKIKFPIVFDHDGKDLIKNLLVGDLSQRYGNLKNGNLL